MPPKIAMGELPPPCSSLKKAMTQNGGEVSLAGLRCCSEATVHPAFHAYRRQLKNWWPDTLHVKYNELGHQGGGDDSRRQCLVRNLLNPSSGGFPEDASSSGQAPTKRTGSKGMGTRSRTGAS